MTDKHKALLKDEGKKCFIYNSVYANTFDVEAPYNEAFVKEIKLIGGRWIKGKWSVYNTDNKEKVCILVDKFYGTSLQVKFLAHKEASIAGAAQANKKGATSP